MHALPRHSNQIEDLLQRDPIVIEDEVIRKDIDDKTILVTGGAGSIGSEIVRQLAEFNPRLVVVLDQAESSLHELEIFLRQNYSNLKLDLRDLGFGSALLYFGDVEKKC